VDRKLIGGVLSGLVLHETSFRGLIRLTELGRQILKQNVDRTLIVGVLYGLVRIETSFHGLIRLKQLGRQILKQSVELIGR